jgi:hypothetical protein
MKHFLVLLFALSLSGLAHAADKNQVLLHPGEVAYVRFETTGKKIRVEKVGPEKDDAAQLVVSFAKEMKDGARQLKVENKFPRDLMYKAEMRSRSAKREARVPTSPVVANKMSVESYPYMVDEIALYDFRLEK